MKGGRGGGTACNPLLLPSLPSHQRPPSINLCQLLPRAKPCLRETDLKGPIKSAAPLWGSCAPTDSGRGPSVHAAQQRSEALTGLYSTFILRQKHTNTDKTQFFFWLYSQDWNKSPQICMKKFIKESKMKENIKMNFGFQVILAAGARFCSGKVMCHRNVCRNASLVSTFGPEGDGEEG